MKTFQLDENISDKELAKSCNEQGLARAKLQRQKDKGRKDTDWVPVVLARGDTLVTADRSVIEDCKGYVPEKHPGIVILENDESILHTFRSRDAKKILAIIKSVMPNWHNDWCNSVVRLSQQRVIVGHIEEGQFVSDGYLSLLDPDWRDQFERIIQFNNSRSAKQLPGD